MKLLLTTVIIFFSMFCHSQTTNDSIRMAIEKERDKMKDYAFCNCLVLSYKLQDSAYGKKLILLESKKDNSEFIMKDSVRFLPPDSKYIQNLDSLFIKDGSISDFFQRSAYNLEAYEAIRSLIISFTKKKYPANENKTLVMKRCMNFYKSKELKEAIENMDKYIDSKKLIK